MCRSDHSLVTNEKQPGWFQESFTLVSCLCARPKAFQLIFVSQGHEGCGQIVELGSEARDSGFKVSDIVVLHAVPGCGSASCDECSRDLAQLCEKSHHSGIGQDGFHADYAVVDVRGLIPLPEGVTHAEAAVSTDAVATAYHAITRRAHLKENETVFLFGLGGLGFNALQIVLNIGARVIVSDIREQLLDKAEALGVARQDIVPVGHNIQSFVAERGLKIDTVLDFVGTHQTFEDAQHIGMYNPPRSRPSCLTDCLLTRHNWAVRRGGKLLCIGSLDTENTIHMKIGTRKRLEFIFSYGSQPRDVEEVLQLIAQGKIRPQVETGGLEEFARVLDDLVAGKVASRFALIP